MKTRNSTIAPSTSSSARLSHQENENNKNQLATESPFPQCNKSTIASESNYFNRRRSPRLKVASGTSDFGGHSSPTSESPTHREGRLAGIWSKDESAIVTPYHDGIGKCPLPSRTNVVPTAIFNNEVVKDFSPKKKKPKTAASSSTTNSKTVSMVRMVSSDDVIDTSDTFSSSTTHRSTDGDLQTPAMGLGSATKVSLCGDTWILEDGLDHIKLNGLHKCVDRFGPPSFYTSSSNKVDSHVSSNSEEKNKTFRSLCRIIAGQQLSGTSATAVWTKLLHTVGSSPSDQSNLTPEKIMSYANQDDTMIETKLRKLAGLSNAKVRYIMDLARHYTEGNLSDDILTSSSFTSNQIRERLLKVKGIGEWSCDMFMMFELHQSNILPLGDLGVRRGISKFFNVKGKGPKGDLCMKKDAQLMLELMKPFEPYRSLATYYMWKVVDTDLWI